MTREEAMELDVISAYYGGNSLTEEQKEFASDFTKNTISFSDPGTGKTHTLVAGLIMAQRYHKIPGKEINCMSFTRAATTEVKSRYDNLTSRFSMSPTVVFSTFHKMSRQILADAYPRLRIVGEYDYRGLDPTNDPLKDMQRYMANVGIESDDLVYVKKVIRAVNTLNSALMFHPEELSRMYSFVELGISIEQFQEIRKDWFLRGTSKNVITQGDIPLYCLYALHSDEDVKAKWRGKYKVMIIDEFQDLSLLHLHILSAVAKTLIVIGDMKQQIYAFNGACPQIVREYLKMYPDARVCNLTRSFRCKQEIADFATALIAPNDPTIKAFTGQGTGGSVEIMPRRELNWSTIADQIAESVKKETIAATREIMFLYRNNASAIPIMEELYKRKILFRNPKFLRVMDVPIFDSLCTLANVSWDPTNQVFVEAALRLFPEFESSKEGIKGILNIIRSTGKDFFAVTEKVRFKQQSSIDIILAMKNARQKILERKSAGVVLNNLVQVYEQYILAGRWWMIDNTKEFYFNLVAPLCSTKEYPVLFQDEQDKAAKNEQNINTGMGVRCYTMHSAKGLEANDVYILDCDEGLFPNSKVMKKKEQAGCLYDIACDIRSERNLLYVAVTRAKTHCVITYSGNEPCLLLSKPDDNPYLKFDQIYKDSQVDFDDVDEFCKLFRLGEYAVCLE